MLKQSFYLQRLIAVLAVTLLTVSMNACSDDDDDDNGGGSTAIGTLKGSYSYVAKLYAEYQFEPGSTAFTYFADQEGEEDDTGTITIADGATDDELSVTIASSDGDTSTFTINAITGTASSPTFSVPSQQVDIDGDAVTFNGFNIAAVTNDTRFRDPFDGDETMAHGRYDDANGQLKFAISFPTEFEDPDFGTFPATGYSVVVATPQ